jgi:hypothetical protein
MSKRISCDSNCAPDDDAHSEKCDASLKRKRAKVNLARRMRDDAMRSLGLVKVKGALGGVYWE